MLDAAWVGYLVVLSMLAIYGAHRCYLVACYWLDRGVTPAPATPAIVGPLPCVTVQLPIFNELYVAERLIRAVADLDWPADRLQIQVLDDSTDETVALCQAVVSELAASGVDIQHVHRTERTGYKAGALEAGLATASGDLVLILDADFLPPRDLLHKTVGYFADPEVAMTQVRWEHLNRDFSSLTRVQAMLLDGHFVVEQSVRHRRGRFFNFNGTAGLWRKSAITAAGGWQHDTLTEDLDLSYRALLEGWRFVYLLGVAAPAELPVAMNAFKSQQFRWAKGSVQVARKLLWRVLRSDLPAATKLEAAFHLTQNVPYLLTLLLSVLVVPALALRPGHFAQSLAIDLPLLVLTTLTLLGYCLTSQGAVTNERWWRVAARIPALVAITVGICINQARAVVEGAFGHDATFVRTPKHGVVGRVACWRHKKYRGPRSLLPVVELTMAAYCGGAAVTAAAVSGKWLAIPILTIFCAGFAYVGVRSAAAT